MIKIAEALPPTPSLVWDLSRQAGADYALGGLPIDDPMNRDDCAWDYLPLARTKQRYNDADFELAVIEAPPPFNKAKRS